MPTFDRYYGIQIFFRYLGIIHLAYLLPSAFSGKC